ncbi:hypothetical protein [Bacillus nitratireducens]
MEKKRIDVIANEEAFHNLSSFTDVEELNKTCFLKTKYKRYKQT